MVIPPVLFQRRSNNNNIKISKKNQRGRRRSSCCFCHHFYKVVVSLLLCYFTGSSGIRSMRLPCSRSIAPEVNAAFCNVIRYRGKGSSTSASNDHTDAASVEEVRRVAIVGGGMAGLSVAYHLLKQQQSCVSVTIFDSMSSPGLGGASSVAGGLLHPFSPRGNKLVHLGEEALKVANQLIDDCFSYDDNSHIVLRDKFYRLANTEEGGKLLQQSAIQYPHLASWMPPEQICETIYNNTNIFVQNQNTDKEFFSTIFGGIVLTNGCKVIYVPSYLQALWRKCQHLSSPATPAHWIQTPTSPSWQQHLKHFDTIVYAAGSGMFLQENSSGDTAASPCSPMLTVPSSSLPISLVRGQSIELNFPAYEQQQQHQELPAILCGKYMCPLPPQHSSGSNSGCSNSTRVLLGATTEHYDFKQKQLILRKPEYAKEDLQKRTSSFFPADLWQAPNFKFTSGWRVQSYRTFQGRLPIVGKLDSKEHVADGNHDAWIFTGLSSRGLLYHGLFGQILSEAIINKSDVEMIQRYPELNWWRRMMASE